MKLPPLNWSPYDYTVENGSPARWNHASVLDQQSTYLAVAKPPPVMLLGVFVAGTTYEFDVRVPAYTPSVRWSFMCAGRGTITITSDDAGESYNADIDVTVGTGVSGALGIDNAELVVMGPAIDSAPGDGLNRALDCTFQQTANPTRYTMTITDYGGIASLEVYSVQLSFDWPDEQNELPG